MTELFQNWQPLVYDLSVIVGAGIIGFIVHFILFKVLGHMSNKTSTVLDDSIVKHVRWPSRYLIILLAINLALPVIHLSDSVLYIVNSVFHSLLIVSVAWLLISLIAVGEDVILSRYNINTRDNLRARKIYTQTQTINKVLSAIIIIIGTALILMGFDGFEQIGTGILASAGIASVVIGFAAQKIFGNFLAGIQLAFTQPIRIDDVVVIENEWGKIEEITLTYVVVRIWDLRRLVLPISYFIEKPFQNWTRVSADLLGTVFIYTDYSINVAEVREELDRILHNSDKWDGKVGGLQVTDSKEHTLELRALMSSADSSLGWDLRCDVREKLIDFIQRKYPQSLPRTRVNLEK